MDTLIKHHEYYIRYKDSMNTKTTTFEDLGVSKNITRALEEIGFGAPFPIQEAAIPLILKGTDIIGQAHTGTGKTAAYSLPILTKIIRNGPIQALILVPTRELAIQVRNEINRFARYTAIRTIAIYGGQSIGIQFKELKKGVQIVVATPGRLIDLIKRDAINLNKVNFVVLDEADRMLDMGFIDDIKFILVYIQEDNRQVCLFSATMPSPIMKLAKEYMKDTQQIRLNEQEVSLGSIDQSYLVISERDKLNQLHKILDSHHDTNEQIIIFVSTKDRTRRLVENLKDKGLGIVTIHGDLSQRERDFAMNRFRRRLDNIMVATDIAARGIDVPTVGMVINYDIPNDPMIYFHRIGRTARAGATGKAVSLVTPEWIDDFGRILRSTNQPIRKLNQELGVPIPEIKRQPNQNRTNYRENRYGGERRYKRPGDRRFGYGRRSYK
jgi:ATP-dependent RNA helicase DeaD